MSADLDKLIEQLESKMAFLERANNELGDVVFGQQRELDELRAQVAALIERFKALKDAPTEYPAEQERPPHY